jgi:hypothetical protein
MEGTTRPRMASRAEGSVLLERERELARIGDLLGEATSGGGRVLFVEGPAGIGKTELLRHAGEMARDERMQVATARGGEVERDLAFGRHGPCVLRRVVEQRDRPGHGVRPQTRRRAITRT